jgi:hypothetical protein
MSKVTKSEVYSWRLAPELKMQLELAARDEKSSIGAVLERITRDWLKRRRTRNPKKAEQERLRAALMACAGMYKGDGTSATNARVREVMGEYLEAKHAGRRAR